MINFLSLKLRYLRCSLEVFVCLNAQGHVLRRSLDPEPCSGWGVLFPQARVHCESYQPVLITIKTMITLTSPHECKHSCHSRCVVPFNEKNSRPTIPVVKGGGMPEFHWSGGSVWHVGYNVTHQLSLHTPGTCRLIKPAAVKTFHAKIHTIIFWSVIMYILPLKWLFSWSIQFVLPDYIDRAFFSLF